MLDVFNRELENIKKNQTEMSTKTEMQNIIKEMKSGLDVIEEKISELEDRIMEITDVKQEKRQKNKKREGKKEKGKNERRKRKGVRERRRRKTLLVFANGLFVEELPPC